MNTLNGLVIFGNDRNNLNFHGELIFKNDGDFCINYIGQNLIEVEENIELIIYGQMKNKKKFTAICMTQSKKISKSTTIDNNVLIKKLFLGDFIDDINQLKISNIFIRTSYFESWFYDFPLNSENMISIDVNSFEIENKINYADEFILSFEYEYNYEIENNKKLTFDNSYYVKIESKNKSDLAKLENESKKVLNLFRFLLPSKDVYIEEKFFYMDDIKIQIFEQQLYYAKEVVKDVTRFDYIVSYTNKEQVDNLIINWFKLCDKYNILIEYLYSIFDDKIIKISELKFLLYIQWIEGFCRVKFPILVDEEKKFDELVNKLKKPFESDSEEFKWIDNQTQNGKQQTLLHNLKKIIKELADNEYIDISNKNRKNISSKIKDIRNELTHLEPNRKNYENMELVYINIYIKGLITYSILNELNIPNKSLPHLPLIHIFKDYDFAANELSLKSDILV